MPITLGQNISSLRAQRQLADASHRLATNYQRVSSGQRINSAGDDAAGLAVSASLNLNARVYTQGVRNANDGISFINIADGALQQLSDITQRQIELATQAANGSFSFAQRQSLNAESNSLADEYNRILGSTVFNGLSPLTNTLGRSLRIQLGYGTSGGIDFERNQQLSRKVGTGDFSSQVTGPSVSSIASYASADFNGDGKLDIAFLDSNTGFVNVANGNGDGSFGSAVAVTASYAGKFGTGDINGDGRDDIVIENVATYTAYTNQGNGTFNAGSAISTPSGGATGNLSLADINGDGRSDLLLYVFGGSNSGWNLALANGDGTFGSASRTGVTYFTLDTGDFNGDGKLDLVGTGAGIALYLNDGNNRFGPGRLVYSPNALGTEVGDLNNDGLADIFALGTGSAISLINQGGGTSFRTNTLANLSATDAFYTLADVNGDGIADITSISLTEFHSYAGTGDGTFQNSITSSYSPLSSAVSLVAGDFNNDGVPDFLLGARADNSVQLGTGTQSTTTARLNLTTQASARGALSFLQSQLERISAERGSIGALQSRLSTAVNTLGDATVNFRAAAGRITDADVAQESGSLVRLQILQNAGAAVLSQANQNPRLALDLLLSAARR